MNINRTSIILTIAFFFAIMISSINGVRSNISPLAIETEIECSSELQHLVSDSDFSEDPANVKKQLFHFSTNDVRKSSNVALKVHLEASLSHWQPPKR